MSTAEKTAPDVYNYLELLAYLQDYYRFRKSNTKGFSYELWTRELGINSRSFVRMVVAGKKKPSPTFIDAFCRQSFSSKTREAYFRLMVKYSRAANAKEKQLYGSQMMQILRQEHEAKSVFDGSDAISDPILPRLLSLLCFADVRATTQFCAQMLNMSMSRSETALAKLESMSLTRKETDQGEVVWRANNDVFHVPDNYGNLNLIEYHRKSLADAIDAFDLPKDLRRYKSLLIPMNERNIKEFNQALEDFIAAQLLNYNGKIGEGNYLFQVNFNFHPVSQKISLDKKLDPAPL